MEETMDQNEVAELSASGATNEARPSQVAVDTVAPAQPAPCPTCGAAAGSPASYIYALGQIETRFPRPSVEKELAQATGRAETAGSTDRQAFQSVLSQRENRYLARQLCWVLTVQGLEPTSCSLAIQPISICLSGLSAARLIRFHGSARSSGFAAPSPPRSTATG
jgi:hypothetical protein